MAQRRPTTVVFDIGNVLIEWTPKALYSRVFDRPEVADWFLANICTPAWNLEQDRGQDWRDAVTALRTGCPEWRAEIEAFDRRWHEMVPRAFTDCVALLERLKARQVPLYSITNFSADKFAECRQRFPFLQSFDGVVVSAHERLVKPDAAIFRVLFERYGLDPAACVFIDDSSANVTAAATAGMIALRFLDAPTLAGDLRSLGFDV